MEKKIILDQQVELIEGDTPEHPYEQDVWVVAQTKNTVRWKIGESLTEDEVSNLIVENDMDVTIT